jgi:hypothetical protein
MSMWMSRSAASWMIIRPSWPPPRIAREVFEEKLVDIGGQR